MDGTAHGEVEAVLQGQAVLLNLTFDAILIRDFTTDAIQFWNRGAERLYGFARDEVIGHVSHDVLQTIHPTSVEAAKAILVRTGHWEGELVHTTRDGARIVVMSRWALQTNDAGPVAILETNTDITARKQVEEALRQSEERYRTIVSTASEGIWLIDTNGMTVYANDRMAQLLGYTSDELAQRTVLECLFPGDEPLGRERIGQNLQGNVEQFDFRFRRKNGDEVLVLACTSPVRDSDGAIIGALGMFTDITARIHAEHERLELLAREQQARAQAEDAQQRLTVLAEASALLASSLDYETTLASVAQAVVPRLADWCAVHLVDEAGAVRRITVSHQDPAMMELAHALEQRYPYDPSAPMGVPHALRTGSSELVTEVSDELLGAVTSNPELVQLVRDLGITSWMVIPMAARNHLLGAITLVAAASRRPYHREDVALAEVLARRAALAIDNARLFREAQRTAAERSVILSQMTDGVLLCDQSGTVTFMNEAARALYGADFTGLSLSHYRGTPFLRDTQGKPYTGTSLPMHRALGGEIVLGEEARLRRPDGSEIVVQRSVTPVAADDGAPLGAIMTVRDVTAQRTLEQQKEDFLSAAAHDLKTPLTALKGTAQLLQRRMARPEGAAPEQLLDGLARIERNASQMTSLINELLDLSRLQMGQSLQLNRRPTDLVALVSRCIAASEDHTGRPRVELQSRVPRLVGVWDAVRLERIVANLLSNATKYSPDPAPIRVVVDEQQDGNTCWAVVSVQDQGIGIPVDDLPHIFERFHRARNVGRETVGTGIGLAGAKQIANQHGGTIDVTSEEGVGSTFTVRLPLTPTDE